MKMRCGVFITSPTYIEMEFKAVHLPYDVTKPANEVNIDPYGHKSDEFQPRAAFEDKFISAMAFCQKQLLILMSC